MFVYDSPRSIIDSIYLGELLDQPLKNSEKNTIKSMFNLPERPTSTTVRDLPWDLLTKYSDPTGLTAAKPLMPTASLDLELHLGGFSLIRTEKFNINTHPHRDKVISLIQDDYRRARAEDIEVGQDHYKRVLDALEEKYKVSYSVFIPPDLPDEGKLPHSTTLTDTFVETSDTNLPSHTATGPSGGFSWTRVLGDNDANYTVLGASDVVRLNDTTGNSHWHRADSDLSTDDFYAQLIYTVVGGAGNADAGVIVRKDSTAAETAYVIGAKSTTDTWRTFSVVTGSFTALGSDTTQVIAVNDVIKGQADGSTIKRFRNGGEQDSVTNSAISGKFRAGIYARASVSVTAKWELDDFEAADVTGGLIIPTAMFSYRQHHQSVV
ncbi:hypothetical protein LCGC14_1866040 [marine sediment metagenome]|uniref:Uncharacterized protein n=1 Tax=marine sediment metagenome TaxID=412755 RepID=A0A0F9G6G8_9ZZZZ